MTELDSRNAVRFYRSDTYKYLNELLAVEKNVPPFPRQIFGNTEEPGAVMLVQEYPHGGKAAFLGGYDEPFFSDCFQWLRDNYNEWGLYSYDKALFSHPILTQCFEVGPIQPTRSYVCESAKSIPDIVAQGEKLVRSDKPEVYAYPQEPQSGNTDLVAMFELFVLHDHGEIFVLKEHNEILAYLCSHHELENIWDIHYIHVREDRRNEGLGTQLAVWYARDKLSAHQIPYYSDPANPSSERVAEKAGFICCKEAWYTELTNRN